MACLKRDWLKTNFRFLHTWYCHTHGAAYPITESDHWARRDQMLDSLLNDVEGELSLPRHTLPRSDDLQQQLDLVQLPHEVYKYDLAFLTKGSYPNDEPYDVTVKHLESFILSLDHDICEQTEYKNKLFYPVYRLIECHAVLRIIYAREFPMPHFNQIENCREAHIALNVAAYFFARGQMFLDKFEEILRIYEEYCVN